MLVNRLGRAIVALIGALGTFNAWANDPASIRLTGPEIVKLDFNTRALTLADLDANGLIDIIVANNEKGRLDLLYQRAGSPKSDREPARTSSLNHWQPVLDDHRFERHSLATGATVLAIANGDWNADGQVDLAFASLEEGLHIRYQDGEGNWIGSWQYSQTKPSQRSDSLLSADFNQDGNDDLLWFASDRLYWITSSATGPKIQHHYPFSGEERIAPLLADTNGDGLDDLLYQVPASKMGLRVREQLANGRFGAERLLRLTTPASALRPITIDAGGGVFASVQAQTGLIEFSRIGTYGTKDSDCASEHSHVNTECRADSLSFAQRVHPVPEGINTANQYALGDVNGDGAEDLVVANPRGAEVWVFEQRPNGTFADPTVFPALSQIRSLTLFDSDRNGQDELYMASADEGIIGVARWQPSQRLSFPSSLSIDGKPLLISGVHLANAATAESEPTPAIAAITRHRRDWQFNLFSPADDRTLYQQLNLADLGTRTDPDGLETIDFNGDGHDDLLIYTIGEPAILLLQGPNGQFSTAGDSRSLASQRRLLNNLQPGDVATADIDNDGHTEVLIAGRGFTRVVDTESSGAMEVRDQFNSNLTGQILAAAIAYDLYGDQAPELMVIPRGGGELELLERDQRALYSVVKSVPIGEIEIIDSRVLAPSTTAPARLLVLGTQQFWSISLGSENFGINTQQTYESPIENIDYGLLDLGDLNGDGHDDLVAIDNNRTQILDVLQHHTDRWESALHFAVFEQPSRGNARNHDDEPRELVVRDINADGFADVLVLVHDRLIIYPGGAISGPGM